MQFRIGVGLGNNMPISPPLSLCTPASYELPPQTCKHDGRGDNQHQGGRGDQAGPGLPQLQEAAHQHASLREGERRH